MFRNRWDALFTFFQLPCKNFLCNSPCFPLLNLLSARRSSFQLIPYLYCLAASMRVGKSKVAVALRISTLSNVLRACALYIISTCLGGTDKRSTRCSMNSTMNGLSHTASALVTVNMVAQTGPRALGHSLPCSLMSCAARHHIVTNPARMEGLSHTLAMTLKNGKPVSKTAGSASIYLSPPIASLAVVDEAAHVIRVAAACTLRSPL